MDIIENRQLNFFLFLRYYIPSGFHWNSDGGKFLIVITFLVLLLEELLKMYIKLTPPAGGITC